MCFFWVIRVSGVSSSQSLGCFEESFRPGGTGCCLRLCQDTSGARSIGIGGRSIGISWKDQGVYVCVCVVA